MKLSITFSVIVAILSLFFAFQNNEPVTISYFKTTFEGSLALIIISALLVGFIVGVVLMIPSVVRARFESKKQKKEIGSLQKELEDSGTISYESEGLGDEGAIK